MYYITNSNKEENFFLKLITASHSYMKVINPHDEIKGSNPSP